MRNRVVHDYGHVDFEIVWETVETHLPSLLKELQRFFAGAAKIDSRRDYARFPAAAAPGAESRPWG